MIKEIIAKELFQLTKAILKKNKKNITSLIEIDEKKIERSLNTHIKIIKNWSNEITFKDIKTAKNIHDTYIDLDLYVYPRKIKISINENIKIIPINSIFTNNFRHIALLGQPGAGKTTSMKYMCQSIFFNEDSSENDFDFPLFIKLRDLNTPQNNKISSGIIYEFLFNVFGLSVSPLIDIKNNEITNSIIQLKKEIVQKLLERSKILLLIDGYDELIYKKHQNIVLKEVRELANLLEYSRLIISSRTSDFNVNFENIHVYEICSLKDDQIIEFAFKWLGDNKDANKFLKAVKKSPFYDTIIRPLTIAHLCAIYERAKQIPDKPKTVYKKIVNLLLEEWDEQRNVQRLSKYAGFEPDRKFEFLSNLAYNLTVVNKSTIFSTEDLEIIYKKIYLDYDLKRNESKKVVQELETHTGLFVQTGYEDYEFAHKSIQEYLTAEYIVKLPVIPNQLSHFRLLPNEFAISVSISSNPSEYFSELVINRINNLKLTYGFYQTFINRLILEKPEFNQFPHIGIAAIILYSNYILLSKGQTSQISAFVPDLLIKELESFISAITKRNSIKLLLFHYDIVKRDESLSGFKVLKLERNKDTFDENYKLPKILYCRDSFIE